MFTSFFFSFFSFIHIGVDKIFFMFWKESLMLTKATFI